MSLAVAEQWTEADCVTATLFKVALSQIENKIEGNFCLFIQVFSPLVLWSGFHKRKGREAMYIEARSCKLCFSGLAISPYNNYQRDVLNVIYS